MSYIEDILKTLPDRINNRNDLMITPSWVAKDMVNLLPAEIWNQSTTFLDPACKSGIFLHEIYLKLMTTETLIKEFPDKAQRRQHILQNQLYGIALDPVSQLMTARTAYGTINGKNNIKLINNYTDIIKNKDRKYFKEALKEKFGQMEFDIVIGNPPYQENDGSGLDGGQALYDKFMQVGSEVAGIISMIVPMRWMIQYRVKGINRDWVNRELHCNQYVHIKYDEESRNIFDGVNIRGGIMYFVKNRKYSGMCDVEEIGSDEVHKRYLASEGIDIFVINDTEEHILEKVHSRHTFDSIVGSTNEFGLESNSITTGTELKLYRSFGTVDTCDIAEIPKGHEFVNMYKVIIGRTFGTGKKGERLPVPRIIGPKEVCTGSLLMIGKSVDRKICENVAKYMQTKFMALLVGMRKSTHHGTKEAYTFVPLQNFSSSSDIDWSQSIRDIDRQLYKKYNLTSDEILYIEKTIRSSAKA